MDKSKFKGMTSFLDLLWILLAGFGAMFIIAFLLIQPPAKEADVVKRAEYMIVLEWEHDSTDDVDLWVMNPNGVITSFQSKTGAYMNLEKDDLGVRNDYIVDEYGVRQTVYLNREVVTLRGVTPGEYEVMIHIYTRMPWGNTTPVNFNVEVIKINPYKVVYRGQGVYTDYAQEISVVRFTVDKEKNFLGYNNNPSSFINARDINDNPNQLLRQQIDYMAGRNVRPRDRGGV